MSESSSIANVCRIYTTLVRIINLKKSLLCLCLQWPKSHLDRRVSRATLARIYRQFAALAFASASPDFIRAAACAVGCRLDFDVRKYAVCVTVPNSVEVITAS